VPTSLELHPQERANERAPRLRGNQYDQDLLTREYSYTTCNGVGSFC
jgi:hypothetical protein